MFRAPRPDGCATPGPARLRATSQRPHYPRLVGAVASLASAACGGVVEGAEGPTPEPTVMAGSTGQPPPRAGLGGAGGTDLRDAVAPSAVAEGGAAGATGGTGSGDWISPEGGTAEPFEDTGGTTGAAGAAGAGRFLDPCAFELGAEPRAWSPAGAVPAIPAADAIQNAELSMVGSWWGVVTTPWMAPYPVELTFSADGHYSARCTANTDPVCPCLAFYYGSDLDDPLKRWDLTTTDGVRSSGTIDIVFKYPPDPGYLPAWQGLLSDVEIDATGDRLRFDFRRDDGYGPVHFDLERALGDAR